MAKIEIYNADMFEKVRELPDDSIDLVLTDPPYFLINDGGSGFLGKSWDSLNTSKAFDILCKSPRIAEIVENFFLSMQIDLNGVVEKPAQENVNTNLHLDQEALNVNAIPVENNSQEQFRSPKVNINSAQRIVVTKHFVLEFANTLSPRNMTAIESLPESALFVLPVLSIETKNKGTALENALKFPIEQICLERIIHLTSMEDARIRGTIEGRIGIESVSKSMRETNGNVNYAESNAEERNREYSVIISDPIEQRKIIEWLTLFLFVSDATKKSKGTLIRMLSEEFFFNFGSLIYPKLKAGSFVVFTMTPRQDILWRCLGGLEKAGFKISHSPLMWLYHSGMPKSLNVSKAFDRREGNQRKVISIARPGMVDSWEGKEKGWIGGITEDVPIGKNAKDWDGWFSYSPKPSLEIIVVAMKPMTKKSIIEQVLDNGHGGVNFEETRIPYADEMDAESSSKFFESMSSSLNDFTGSAFPIGAEFERGISVSGRFPSNLLTEGSPLIGENNPNKSYSIDKWAETHNITLTEDSAFLDVPKPANSEKETDADNTDVYDGKFPSSKADKDSTAKHPTSKPYRLYTYLCKMFGKKDWTVLDPFMGSGTTGIACAKMGMNFIGVERDPDYFSIAEKRLTPYMKQTTLEEYLR